MSKSFFIDTADTQYIRNAWMKLSPHFTPSDFVGVTTNPNAIFKANITNISELEIRVKELCELVSKIRNDDKGVVYVQHPSSTVSVSDLTDYVKKIASFSDGKTKVGLKIPPFAHILKAVSWLKQYADINVTGVADACTALMAFTYDVRYVSIIPGRMEESGIDANAQMLYVAQRNDTGAEVITGSMRTMEGLHRAIDCYTVPTIGTRVFDTMFAESREAEFASMWDSFPPHPVRQFAPTITDTQTELSYAFFKQMDECGAQFTL